MNRDITLKDGKLFFGKHEVRDYTHEEGQKLCELFAIRYFENGWWQLATTMDIADDYIWLCGYGTKVEDGMRVTMPSAYYDRWEVVEWIFNRLCHETAGKEWAIFRDDHFLHQENDYDDYYPYEEE